MKASIIQIFNNALSIKEASIWERSQRLIDTISAIDIKTANVDQIYIMMQYMDEYTNLIAKWVRIAKLQNRITFDENL